MRTLDGAESTLYRIRRARLFEVQKHLSLTRHGYTAAPLVMNLAKFSGLPGEQRMVILEAALEAALHERELNDQLEQKALLALRAPGVEIVADPDVAAFRAAVAARVRTRRG